MDYSHNALDFDNDCIHCDNNNSEVNNMEKTIITTGDLILCLILCIVYYFLGRKITKNEMQGSINMLRKENRELKQELEENRIWR